MKPSLLFFFLFPLLLVSQSNKKVLFIGIDGCRSDALTAAVTPNIDGLKNNGTWSPDALNEDITISGPGWSSSLCGVRSDKHLVTGNNFTGNNYANYPSIVKYIEAFNPNLLTASLCVWDPINDEIIQDDADYKSNFDNDTELTDEAISYLLSNDPDFLFLHFDEIDGVGHSTGFSPNNPAYINIIEETDMRIGEIIEALENRPNYDQEDWLIMITSDHGGVGNTHGGIFLDERKVTVIASGNSVPNSIIEASSSLVPNCLGNEPEMLFDGPDGIIDWVSIPHTEEWNFGADIDFTVECRVRTTSPGDVAIVGNKDWSSGLNKGFVFSFEFPNGPSWKVNIGDGTNRVDINNGGEIADGLWHTLSVSFDRDGMMKMYQDGIFIAESDISNIGNINGDNGLNGILIGADSQFQFPFTGSIAEVRVFDEVVDATAINAWHCTSLTPSHPSYNNLLGYWKLNNSDPIQEDLSSNGLDGNLFGTTLIPPQTSVYNDYTLTPRLVDLPYTALVHLCIPIQESWDLDGKSLIPELENDQMLLNLKVLLEGPFNANTGMMNDNLRLQSLIGLVEPYTALGYTHVGSGGEDILPGILDVTGDNAIVDWMFVELRNALSPDEIIATKVALVQKDGDIVERDGESFLLFDNIPSTNVFIAVKHRSHLGIRTGNFYERKCAHAIDLTKSNASILGDNPVNLISDKNVMVSGDANNDGTVNTFDKNIHWRVENGVPFTYPSTLSDFNLDGVVNAIDLNLYWRPNNSRQEEVE